MMKQYPVWIVSDEKWINEVGIVIFFFIDGFGVLLLWILYILTAMLPGPAIPILSQVFSIILAKKLQKNKTQEHALYTE